MMKPAARAQVRRCFRAVAIGTCCPFLAAHAQEASDQVTDNTKSIDEIVVVVDRDGKTVNMDMRRLEEARLKVIREFELEQHKQEEEMWRLRLRSTMKRKTSRIAFGYDAQKEAARFRYTQASYLPIDRVQPASIVSIRF